MVREDVKNLSWHHRPRVTRMPNKGTHNWMCGGWLCDGRVQPGEIKWLNMGDLVKQLAMYNGGAHSTHIKLKCDELKCWERCDETDIYDVDDELDIGLTHHIGVFLAWRAGELRGTTRQVKRPFIFPTRGQRIYGVGRVEEKDHQKTNTVFSAKVGVRKKT